jgi:hypothetical protein
MNDEPPKDLATRAFQKRVLDEFAAVRRELSEARAEAAARNDLPVRPAPTNWETIQERVLKSAEKLDLVLQDLYEVRGEVRNHGRRLDELERKGSPVISS